MKTRQIISYKLKFISEDGEVITDIITSDDLCDNETVDEYIEEKVKRLCKSTDVKWEGKLLGEESFRL